ncbi:MAG: PTS fructose transporter subunit IIA [Rubrivivax sp.]|jgi:PTS system ascorbate-specific IIA component|nr:PTS fructose transporter subunit IIA [Rubrivivax sp.]
MAGLLILAHAPLASSLKAVAGHVYPDCAARVAALDVEGSAGREEVEQAALRAIAALGLPQVLVLTDVFGATPCNAAMQLAPPDVAVRVVAGVNVPMLWRTLCYADEPLDALVARAVSGATQGVMQVSLPRQQNQNQPPGVSRHDPVPHRHQQ